MFREYSPYEITQATDKIYKHIIKDYNVRNQLGSGDGTNNMPKDLRNAIFYHESFRDCKWLKSDLTNVGGNGTIFSNNDFLNSTIDNASLQYCNFSNDVFWGCSMYGSNFANSTFSDFAIINGNIFGCSFVGSMLNGGIIRDTPIECSTFERCMLKNVKLENLDLRQLTLNYATFDDVMMKNVGLPFIQLPYTFNGLQYVYDTTDDIYIASHEKADGKMNIARYMDMLPDFIIFFDSQDQYFPLTNCYIVNHQQELAVQCNEQGIITSALRHNFRSLYFYCLQASKILQITSAQRKQIYSKIQAALTEPALNVAEYHQFCIYYPMIKRLLFDRPTEKPVLMLSLKTNIKPNDYDRLSTLITALEEVTQPFEKKLDSKHIEIRHNSPDIVDFFLSGNFQLLVDNLQTVYDMITPIIADLSAIMTVGTGLYQVIKKLHEQHQKKVEKILSKENSAIGGTPKEEIQFPDIKRVHDEINQLHNAQVERVLEQIQFSKVNSPVPNTELMNLQEKLSNSGIVIEDIEIQYFDEDGDVLSSLYQKAIHSI